MFDNTEVALALKSDSELERARFLFEMIKREPLVKIDAALTKFALKVHFPIQKLAKIFPNKSSEVISPVIAPK